MVDTTIQHSTMADDELHLAGFVQESDPKVAGLATRTGEFWFKPSTSQLFVLNGVAWDDKTNALRIGGKAISISSLTDGQTLTYNAATQTFINSTPSGAGGGVAGPETSTNNALSRFSGTGGDTLKDSTLILEDNGALHFSGGNTRGTKAVDLQNNRAQVTDVASGVYSTIAGGESNTASGARSAVGGGLSNDATGPTSTVGGGDGNLASGADSTIAGGTGNTASASCAAICGGDRNTASGSNSAAISGYQNVAGGIGAIVLGGASNVVSSDYGIILGGASNAVSGHGSIVVGGAENQITAPNSVISGGYQNTVLGSYSVVPGGHDAIAKLSGQMAFAGGCHITGGDAQTSLYALKAVTDGFETATLMPAEGALVLPANGSWAFDVLIVGRCSTGTAYSAMMKFSGLVDSGALIATNPVDPSTSVIADTELAAVGATVTVIPYGGGLNQLCINVGGISDLTIYWFARLVTSELCITAA